VSAIQRLLGPPREPQGRHYRHARALRPCIIGGDERDQQPHVKPINSPRRCCSPAHRTTIEFFDFYIYARPGARLPALFFRNPIGIARFAFAGEQLPSPSSRGDWFRAVRPLRRSRRPQTTLVAAR